RAAASGLSRSSRGPAARRWRGDRRAARAAASRSAGSSAGAAGDASWVAIANPLSGESPWAIVPGSAATCELSLALTLRYLRRVTSPRDLLRALREELQQMFLERTELID